MLPAELKTLEIDPGGRDRPDFGTVRPRVQIPGPRPILSSKSPIPHAVRRASEDGRSRPCHRFSWNSAAADPVQDCGRRLNSLTAIAQPIYQHAHGPRTVRHPGSKIEATRQRMLRNLLASLNRDRPISGLMPRLPLQSRSHCVRSRLLRETGAY
jgi:hypothetical protein